MGKAAENERLKLRATWWNNLSIGTGVGGLLVPYINLIQNDWYLPSMLRGEKGNVPESAAYSLLAMGLAARARMLPRIRTALWHA